MVPEHVAILTAGSLRIAAVRPRTVAWKVIGHPVALIGACAR